MASRSSRPPLRSGARPSGPRPVRLRDLAEALNVSIGTVDRALHGRGRISPETRSRVLAEAEALGYRPNLAARYLSAGKALRVAICLPRAVASFYGEVRAGIDGAAEPLVPGGLELAWHDFARLGTGEVHAVRAALAASPGGLIVAPGDPATLGPALDEAAARRIPVVCVTTDAPGHARLAAITVDPRTSGALVGELIGRCAGGVGRIAAVSGSLGTTDHAEKVAGLEHACRRFWPALRLVEVIEAHDDEREARRKTKSLLRSEPALAGLYVATANSIPVLDEIMRAGRERLVVITTDLFPALVPFIERGLVAATIHQRPRTQGQLAFDTLRRHLVDGVVPPDTVRLSPHVVMRSNLHLFSVPADR